MSQVNKDQLIAQILANKPDSIHDVIPSEFFTKYDSYDYVWSKNCFEWYWALGKAINPKSFLEIGVRFGFSFVPTMIASSNLQYALGWDLETYGDNNIARQQVSNYYSGEAKWSIDHVDSQTIAELPQFFDLVSIDGCHDYHCKIHDLVLCIGNCSYVILDDYDYHRDVRESTDEFLNSFKDAIEWSHYFPTFRGSLLIKYK